MNRNKLFYQYAYTFLLEKTPDFINKDIINSYLKYANPEENVSSLNNIYERMLSSAQSQNMYPKVIGASINGVHNLGKVLDDFNVKYVIDNYEEKEDLLLNNIENILKPKGQIRRDSKSLWPKYCKTIVSTAKFLNQFKNHIDFVQWINNFYNDEKSIAILPFLISTEVYGFGFALVCDFLKDLGYVNYGKPDVHIKDILFGFGFIKENDSDYNVLKTMIKMSKDAEVTCFEFDRILWLIGSGNFYNHTEFGNNGLIGRLKEQFINTKDEFEKLA
ncbi:MAG: hypothetical protein GX677_05125 [Treponema sp.]|jgi:thermostable 8-oxoguanine DNA glycosylase|nr:hypothetical protein [Treponema sp.]